jgi:acetate kinase
MKPANPRILTINGGSSSIKFALYHVEEPLKRGVYGKVDRIGLSGTNLTFNEPTKKQPENCKLAAADHKTAANSLIDWLEKQNDFKSVQAVGHRVVHGMKHIQPEIVSQELLDELHRIRPYDPDHLPREIELIEAFRQRQSGTQNGKPLAEKICVPEPELRRITRSKNGKHNNLKRTKRV